MKKVYNYLKAVVIVHGKSEKQLCEWLRQNERIKIDIVSSDNGKSSIQITSLNRVLKNKQFRNKKSFLNTYPDIEYYNNNISDNFKIFIIMDTDDCTEKEKKEYINKGMFKNHWAYNYIVPIYNNSNLEEVLSKVSKKYELNKEKKGKKYEKVFPTNKNRKNYEVLTPEELYESLKGIKETNLEELIYFCLMN